MSERTVTGQDQTWGRVTDRHAPGVRLLGSFSCGNGDDDVELPYGAQRLMAYLALNGPCRRTLVAGSLWPTVTDSQALGSLRTGVWRINKSLPGVLVTHGNALTLGSSFWVDCRELEDLAAALLRRQLDDVRLLLGGLPLLTAGELLPGWYDDWVTFERDRLRQLRLQAIEVTVRLLLENGEIDMALDLALQAVRAEPMRETAHVALIRVYLAEGNFAEALGQSDSYRDLLQRELGLEPSAQLTELTRSLERRRVSLVSPR
jgi:DNA-binding SARP family transcriptional activator